MAKILVMSDDARIHVEIFTDDETGANSAVCMKCGENIVADTHEQWSMDDTIQAAEIHIDYKH